MSDDIDRTDEYLELIAEDERREAAAANGRTRRHPAARNRPTTTRTATARTKHGDDKADDDEPTTWEPIDLGPWLNGEIDPPPNHRSASPAQTDCDSSTPAANTPSSAKPNAAKHGWRWAASPPNSPQATTSSTSTTRKATPAAPSNACNCSTSTPP